MYKLLSVITLVLVFIIHHRGTMIIPYKMMNVDIVIELITLLSATFSALFPP